MANDVEIMYNADYRKYLGYVKEKYGREWLQQFRTKRENDASK